MSKNLEIKNLFMFQFIYILTIPLGFLIRVLYTKSLTLEEFGFIYSLISFFTFLSLFVNLGFSGSLKYYIPKFLSNKKYSSIRNIFYYSYILSTLFLFLFSLIIYFSAKALALFYFKNPNILLFLKIWLIYFIFFNLTQFIRDVLLSFKKNLNFIFIQFLQLFLTIVFSFGIYYFNFTNLINWYSFIWGGVNFLIFIFYIIYLFRLFPFLLEFPTYNSKLLKDYLKYSFGIFSFSLGNKIFSQTDMLVIIYFLSTNFAGIYSNIVAIINIFISFFTVVGSIFMPLFSELEEKKEFEKLSMILNFFYSNIFFILLPLSVFIIIFSKEILMSIYGKEFATSFVVLQLLLIFVTFKIVYMYNLNFLSGLGKLKSLNKIIISITLFNLIFNILIVNYVGLPGVSIITGISWLLMGISTYIVLRKEINFNLNMFNLVKIILLNIFYYFLLVFLKTQIYFYNKYLTGLILLIISLGIYIILGYLLKIYSLETLYIFIPNSKIKTSIIKFQKKYFNFLK